MSTRSWVTGQSGPPRRNSRAIGVLLVGMFLIGCAPQEIELEVSNIVLDPTDPKQIIVLNEVEQGESDVILELRQDVDGTIAFDGRRMYWNWTSAGSTYRDLLQSCVLDDCLNTFMTYQTSGNLTGFVVKDDHLIWSQSVIASWSSPESRGWELRGTSSNDSSLQPLLLDSGPNTQRVLAVLALADLLYWWRPGENASSLLRCDPARCEETRETVVEQEVPTAVSQILELVLAGTHAYWLERSLEKVGAHVIRRVALEGERVVETVLESPTFLSGLSVRDDQLIWAVNNFASPIQSCDVNNCSGTVHAVVANQQYTQWTGTTKKHLLWTTDGELRACALSNCEATIETVAEGPHALVVTEEAVYYTTFRSESYSYLIHRRMLP